jgi:hypothetical protein
MSDAPRAGPEPRRRSLRGQEQLNGIDYVEIGEGRRTLKVTLFHTPPEQLTAENFRVTGGVRVRNPAVIEVRLIEPPDPDLERSVRLIFAHPGDTSTYRLHLHDIDGFDPRYARIDFTFGDGMDYRLDCVPAPPPLEPPPPAPELDYLAKDYGGFRRLALDRLAQVMPDWNERHVPDLGVTLVEMLAYVGDQLSYYQDAVATEAYLGTARLRTSVRRHARLIDYAMHEGCNARVWVHLDTAADIDLPAAETRFAVGYETPAFTEFSPLVTGALRLSAGLNAIDFYAWGDGDGCLLRGSVAATLRDDWLDAERSTRRLDGLAAGQALLIETTAAPDSEEDPDPRLRHVVRLVHVGRTRDPLYDLPVVEIRWAAEDALPFDAALPPPATLPPPAGGLSPDTPAPAVYALARGNMVLADHGRTVTENLVPPRRSAGRSTAGEDRDALPADARLELALRDAAQATPAFAAAPWRPSLRQRGLTFRQRCDPLAPASLAVHQDPGEAEAQVLALWSVPEPAPPANQLEWSVVNQAPPADRRDWSVRPDLIESGPDDRHFVVEMDDDRTAVLRFGDGERGARPPHGAVHVVYRIGNGPSGNVAAETITRVLDRHGREIAGVTARNPLPASGGTAPESITDVKLYAPHVFRSGRRRAVTADDYARAAEEVFGVRRAAADLLLLGAIRLAKVAILTLHGDDPTAELRHRVEAHLHRHRRIGHDVAVSGAQMVPLDIALSVGVRGDYLRGHVLAALREALGSATRRDGRPGLFHPDLMSFGTPVHASQIVAVAQGVTGVEWVRLTRLRRLIDAAPEDPGQLARAAISLPLGPFEVARADNDAAHPEHGRLEITLVGGR